MLTWKYPILLPSESFRLLNGVATPDVPISADGISSERQGHIELHASQLLPCVERCVELCRQEEKDEGQPFQRT